MRATGPSGSIVQINPSSLPSPTAAPSTSAVRASITPPCTTIDHAPPDLPPLGDDPNCQRSIRPVERNLSPQRTLQQACQSDSVGHRSLQGPLPCSAMQPSTSRRYQPLGVPPL
ncbi:hypothetical protein PCANC_16259 [Puccinia coronata f. sp. avenae]|uniref:Uncharacterized protein n=1 Tax=Puccinia coronata f. sp. avenae TaxID=200324 RepID=A0A2N5U7N8_9BASI|nr:hypothetical protein PCANC_16259 [Puccinia coronata f. sp. avenae]